MDFSALSTWEDYPRLEQQFTSTDPHVQAAHNIYKSGLSSENSKQRPADAVYYLNKLSLTAGGEKFNVLLNEIETLEGYGPFRETETTAKIDMMPANLGAAKRGLRILDQILSSYKWDADDNAQVLGGRAAVFIGMCVALVNQPEDTSDVGPLMSYGKDVLGQFVSAVTPLLARDSPEKKLYLGEPIGFTAMEKIKLGKKIINARLTIMVGVTIILIIVLNFLWYNSSHQKRTSYTQNTIHVVGTSDYGQQHMGDTMRGEIHEPSSTS